MAEVTAYSNPDAPVYRQWIAYVVLDNGKLWGVYATGATKEAAEVKIKTLWDSERAKFNNNPTAWVKEEKAVNPWGDNRGHHLKGLVWMVHKGSGQKVRIKPEEVDQYTKEGFERGGPRSK